MDTRTAYKRDMAGAILMILLGIVVAVTGSNYRMGTLTRMGAGYVPVVLGVLLVVVGLLIVLTTRRDRTASGSVLPDIEVPQKQAWQGVEWRGWGCILAGVAAFVGLGHYGGMVPATFAAVFISAMGDRDNSIRDAALLAALITVAGVVIFSWGLKLVFPLFIWG